ncbi:MAG: hypothetical protein ACOX5G_05960 [Kiritimatiellia bacterium]|jgi:hypothetical protein
MKSELTSRLRAVNNLVNRWKALEHLLFAAGGSALALAAGAGVDFAWRVAPGGRIALAAVWMLVALAGLVLAIRAVAARRSPAAVAALLERHFPQLDNHLINHVLFAEEAGRDPLREAYLRGTSPGLDTLPLSELRPNRKLAHGLAALCAGLVALAAPAPFSGEAWGVAVRRVLNPFSSIEPASLAHVLEVLPGDLGVPQGDAADLSCRVLGHAGQTIDLELLPDDDRPTLLRLGRIGETGAEERFAHRVPKVVGGFRYRFIAGDAPPTPYYRVVAIPPLTLSGLVLRVEPPAHTGLPVGEVDALGDLPTFPRFSSVSLSARFSRAVDAAEAILGGDAPAPAIVPFVLASPDAVEGTAGPFVATNGVLRVTAAGRDGGKLDLPIRLDLVPDRPPSIRILEPGGPAVLPPGAAPAVAFEVTDDYGVALARLERVARGAAPAAEGAPLAEWNATNGIVSAAWRGTPSDLPADGALRVVAFDRAEGVPNRAVSPLIVFERQKASEIAGKERAAARASAVTLGQIVERQRANLDATLSLAAMLPAMDPASWEAARGREGEILGLAAQLLREGVGLGVAKVALERAARGPMAEAEIALGRMAGEPAEGRAALAARAIAAQETALRILAQASAAVESARVSRASSGLLAQIEALIKAQEGLCAATRAAAAAKRAASDDDCDRQDDLAMDVGELVDQCRRDAKAQGAGDEAFAASLSAVADLAEQRAIKNDMLHAAEAMSGTDPSAAIPLQERAIESLKALCAVLNEQRAAETAERMQEAAEVVAGAKEAAGKLKDLQSAVVEALRATEGQEDKSRGSRDEALDLEIAELQASMADAALKIATDLQVFPDLPVGNELVEDLFQVYEAMAQPEGSESTAATELGLQKEDWILEALATAEGRLDDMEMWLTPRPDAIKRNIENFDREELPQIGMVTMPEELEDIIGDLLEQEDELREQADDSTGNQGTADIAAGWDIMEGEFTSYGAKGKSGNERPEHKDQDGRSNVGRQGQSDGEVVGASGKINDGDENIEKRMTRDSSQAGEVEEEDHREAKATGGGKLSGYGEEEGMSGLGPRRDSSVNRPSELGRQAMLRRSAETLYARATMNNLRTGRLDEAIRHMRSAEEALEKGLPIQQVREFQRRASVALRETRADLDAGVGARSLGAGSAAKAPDADVASTPDEAPPAYRSLVSDYFKALGEM